MSSSNCSILSPLPFRCNKVESSCIKSHQLYLVYLQDSCQLIEWRYLTFGECIYKPVLILSVIGSPKSQTWSEWQNRSSIELKEKIPADPDEDADILFYKLGKRMADVKGESTPTLTRHREDGEQATMFGEKGEPTPTHTKHGEDGEQPETATSFQLHYTFKDHPDVDRSTQAVRQCILFALTKEQEPGDKCIECAITMNDVEEGSFVKNMQKRGVPVVVLKNSCKNSYEEEINKSREVINHFVKGSNSQCEQFTLDFNENDFIEKLLDHIINHVRKEVSSKTKELAMLRVYLDMKLIYEANEPGTSNFSFKDLNTLLEASVILSRAKMVKDCLKSLKSLKGLNIEIQYDVTCKEVLEVKEKMLAKDYEYDHSDEYFLKKLFIDCLISKKFDVSKVIWKRFAFPVGAALSAYKLLKVMAENDDCDYKSTNVVMMYFQNHAVKSLTYCYKCNPSRTADLLGIIRPDWNNKTYFRIAYKSECDEFLAMNACHDISDRVWHYGTADLTQKTHPLTLTPRWLYFADLFSRSAYLLMYGLLLVRYLTDDSFHPLEWLVWALSLFELLQIIVAEFQEIYKDSLVKYFHVQIRKNISVGFQGSLKRNVLRLSIASTFIVAWTLRYLANSSYENKYLMSWARMAFGLNYIGFSIRFLQAFYSNENLGPLIIMFKNIGWFLLNFFLLILIFFISYGVASQSVYFHGSRYDPLLIFYQSFWTMLGQYPLLDELGFNGAEITFNCTDNSCLDTAERYYLSIILGVYGVIINILLFNLLIAKFTAIINLDEKTWRQTWHIQSLELTMMYSRLTVWPPLIVLFQCIWLLCYKCCCYSNKCQFKDPFIVMKTDSKDFEKDALKQYLEQVELSESQMERNSLSKWLDADRETKILMKNVETRLQSSTTIEHRDVNKTINVSSNGGKSTHDNADNSQLTISMDEEQKVLKQDFVDILNEQLCKFEQLIGKIFSGSQKWEKKSTKINRHVERLKKELRQVKGMTNELDQAVSRASQLVMDLNEKTSQVISRLSEDQVDGDRLSVYQNSGNSGTMYQNSAVNSSRLFRGSEQTSAASVMLSEESIIMIAKEVARQIKTRSFRRGPSLNPELYKLYGKEEDQANKEVASVVLTARLAEKSSKGNKFKKKKGAYFAVRTRHRYGPKWRCYKVTEKTRQ